MGNSAIVRNHTMVESASCPKVRQHQWCQVYYQVVLQVVGGPTGTKVVPR